MGPPNPSWKPGDRIDRPAGDPVSFGTDNDSYGLLVSAVVPRPIALVSTISQDGAVNLAPFSFFNLVSARPPALAFSIATRAGGGKKHTLSNIEATGEFVVNSANEWFAEAMAHCGGEFDEDANEMEISGLTPTPSVTVKPPRVSEAGVQIECALHDIVRLGEEDGTGSNLVIGRILLIHTYSSLLANGVMDPLAYKPISRMGGPSYAKVGEMFDLSVPKTPSGQA